ncbi:MAG: M23 family metallopeptidase [Alistipes sp.]|nr:M23 family metallopeptidase [Alistipes sp.]
MKKKIFSGNKKTAKGFYAALGISAVMIGSACYFAYDQGEKLTEEFSAKNVTEEPVDRQLDNIPKGTTASYKLTTPTVTMAAVTYPTAAATAPPAATLPAAEIIIDPAEPVVSGDDSEPVSVSKLENVKAPLDSMDEIIGTFSGGELVKSETTGSWQTHNGTDISAEVGAEVFAVSNGEIMSVENDPVWGVTVVLDHHNGYVTKYCGLSTGLSVQAGDMLVSGDVIGTVGNTADIESALAPHLHIEMTHNGSYIDPLSEINKG